MSEEIKLQFTTEDIAVAEVVKSVKKISNETRKVITWTALIIVITKGIEMFFNTDVNISIYSVALYIVSNIVIIGLAVGFFLFYREEKNIYLLFSSILVFIGGLISLPGNIIDGLIVTNIILTSDSNELTSDILTVVSYVSLLAGFILMKMVLDGFRQEKRNIFKGQLSLPIGYALLLVRFVMYMIVPLDSVTHIDVNGRRVPNEGSEAFVNTAYFMGIAAVVMVIMGFWYLRRAYGILDKLPEGFFEKQEARKAAMTQQRAQRSQRSKKPAQTMLGLGRQRPIAPSQRKEDEIDYKNTIIPPEEFKGKKMFCVKCGLELEHDAVFCSNCGETNPYIKR